MHYILHLIIIISIYVIITTSSNLLMGMAGLLSLGQAALYGIGAYIGVFSLMGLNIPLIPAIIFVMLLVALSSMLIAYPSLRLKGDYFVVATLGFQLITFTILYNWISVTNGPFGISGIPAPELFGYIPVSGTIGFTILCVILAMLTILCCKKLIRSPFGRVLKGLREDELALLSLGRNVTVFKIWTFVISSAIIGVAGFLYAAYIGYIDPTSFNLNESIFILAAVLIGGTGNVKGPIIGAVFVVLLPEFLRFVGFPDSVAANLRQIIYGLVLIVIMYFRPQGLAGVYKLN